MSRSIDNPLILLGPYSNKLAGERSRELCERDVFR